MLRVFESKQKETDTNDSLYQEMASMAKVGSWRMNLDDLTVFWDQEAQKIHEVPSGYILNIEESINFITADHRENATMYLEECRDFGTPFEIEVEIKTFTKNIKWIRIAGKPVFEGRKIVGMRGVFQDIHELKTKEVTLQKSLDIVASQNAQLLNFAHIVSHNLRSHSSNLELVLDILDSVKGKKEKREVLNNLKQISSKLNETITHLNEVVTVNSAIEDKLRPVDFDNSLQVVLTSINELVKKEEATVKADFSALPSIDYIPAYLESILLNLITNAIKYRKPEIAPIIEVKSFMRGRTPVLTVIDNGLGIDLDMHGDKLFGMYKTFHDHPDAKGIGLFITKNQIESLHGSISVESTVGVGSKFTVEFKNV
ncbi:ATP-binding protein [Sungkyunkwania multivorans]|uniref:histidine kinase n=1 Tax=Sungkyunkwania multivorans TaxID=1173618 RepID=A0ABW3D2Z1_9FLAO